MPKLAYTTCSLNNRTGRIYNAEIVTTFRITSFTYSRIDTPTCIFTCTVRTTADIKFMKVETMTTI